MTAPGGVAVDGSGLRRLRVVIIDDTQDLRDLLSLALTRDGMAVAGEAGDGLAGIEVVRRQRPDVVLLDLSMPVMDGLAALPRIRALAPSSTIIILSGFEAVQMAQRALSLGADGYVQKGAPLTEVISRIRELAAVHDLRVERTGEEVSSAPVEAFAAPGQSVEMSTSSIESVALAPYGVIRVTDDPGFKILEVNPEGIRVLGGEAGVGSQLAVVAPELTTLVAFHRLEDGAVFEVELHGDFVRCMSRRSTDSLHLYLDASGHAVTLLRRAIATTAHEIRGPVTVLGGVAETLEEHGDQMDTAQRRRLMTAVARQARMLDSITADLLTAAQMTRGTVRVQARDVDPVGIIDIVIADRYAVAVHRKDDRQLSCDPLRLEQMMSNLIGNAHKYGRAPYSVIVRPSHVVGEEDMVCIDVVDSGDGVPREFVEQLFREFSRAAGTVASGTGLGLYVVRTLAEAQGGRVEYAAVPGGGARFTVVLPAASE